MKLEQASACSPEVQVGGVANGSEISPVSPLSPQSRAVPLFGPPLSWICKLSLPVTSFLPSAFKGAPVFLIFK